MKEWKKKRRGSIGVEVLLVVEENQKKENRH